MLELGHVANVVARALIPIIGVAFLGWSGTKLLVVYFADTLAALYATLMLALYAGVVGSAEYQAWARDGLALGKRLQTGIRVAVLPLPLLLILGFFFGVLPLFVMLDLQQAWWGELLADRELWIAVGCQFAAALTLLLDRLDWVRTVNNRNTLVRQQLGLVCARWGAMILVGFFLAPYIPRLIYGPLLIVTYAVASIAIELAPQRVLELLARVIGGRGDTVSAKPAASTTNPRTEERHMAIDSKRVELEPSKVPTWVLAVVGAAFAVFGAIGLWEASDATLHSVTTTARVLEHHATSARSASIVAQVEVAVPDARAFKTEIYDGLGMGTWEDGGTVQVTCTKLRSTYTHCELDSLVDRWLFPVLFFAIGAMAVWWWWYKFGRASIRSSAP